MVKVLYDIFCELFVFFISRWVLIRCFRFLVNQIIYGNVNVQSTLYFIRVSPSGWYCLLHCTNENFGTTDVSQAHGFFFFSSPSLKRLLIILSSFKHTFV
jgi:hypothetical protein